MYTRLSQRFFAWLASFGARRRPSPQDWVNAMPPELEAVVFTPTGRAVFLRSPDAASANLEMIYMLHQPENEDLFEQLVQRFRERRVH